MINLPLGNMTWIGTIEVFYPACLHKRFYLNLTAVDRE